MTNLDSILKKQRHQFADKVHIVKAMVFPVVIYGCESWTIKRAVSEWVSEWSRSVVSDSLWPHGHHGVLRPWRTSKEGWAPKNWCFWNVVVEKTLESPLGYKIKPVNPKKNQPWILIGRTNAEAEAPILWPPDAKSQLIGKDPDAGKDWGHEEKGMTEDEMVR